MTALFLDLSWSAVHAGWDSHVLAVHQVRTLAEHRICAAQRPEELMALSELASLHDHDWRSDAAPFVRRLAQQEGRSPSFALREWQVFRLQCALDHLPGIWTDDPTYLSSRQLRTLHWAWAEAGRPPDWPDLTPHVMDPDVCDEALLRVLTDLGEWLKEQREALARGEQLAPREQ